MGVRVDEPGGYPATAAIDDIGGIGGIRRGAGEGDPAVAHADRADLDDAETGQVGAHRGETGVGPQAIAAHALSSGLWHRLNNVYT
jgi:hypothetical protein